MTTPGRLALLYSDGTIGILAEAATLGDARREREYADHGEADPAHWTKIARVELFSVVVVEDPAAEGAAAAADAATTLEELRAENARLRARLAPEPPR